MISIKIQSLDHVAFNVADAERSLRFYAQTLGLPVERVDEFRAGTVPFPSVRVNAETIVDLFPPEYHRSSPTGNNVNHIAMTVDGSADSIKSFLDARGVPIAREMTGNFGARGDSAHAFHVFDPDGNLIELHAYE